MRARGRVITAEEACRRADAVLREAKERRAAAREEDTQPVTPDTRCVTLRLSPEQATRLRVAWSEVLGNYEQAPPIEEVVVVALEQHAQGLSEQTASPVVPGTCPGCHLPTDREARRQLSREVQDIRTCHFCPGCGQVAWSSGW